MNKLRQKKIMIYGYGVTGQDVANVFNKENVEYFIVDDNLCEATKEQLIANGVNFYTAQEFLQNPITYDLIVKSPGIKYENELLQNVEREKIINDIEITHYLTANQDVKIVAITGTNGKTSTTSFITALLNSVGYKAFSCGNIGVSPIRILDEEPQVDFLVMELSSFQLKAINKFQADYAFFLNFAPDHLDFHPDLADYYQSKLKIIKNVPKSGKLYAGEELDLTGITVCNPVTNIPNRLTHDLKGVSRVNMNLIYQFAHDELKISEQQFIKALENEYTGLEHRCEYVGAKNGIQFYNDSKATNVESTRIALEQLDNIILLVGGSDKGEDMTNLNQYAENVKHTIAYGANQNDFTLQPIDKVPDLETAFASALKLAQVGDTILLSPASASFDQYKNYEERGKHFKQITRNYLGE